MSLRFNHYQDMSLLHRLSHFFRNDGELIVMGKGCYLVTDCKRCKTTQTVQEMVNESESEIDQEDLRMKKILQRPLE